MLLNPNYKLPEYAIWSNVIQRCENPKHAQYKDYGGRGIKICKRWRDSFTDFFSDVGPRPEKGLTLNRIDNNGDYEPENVEWANKIKQANNTRRNKHLTINGETKTIAQWAKEAGIEYGTLFGRIGRGVPIEELLKPVESKYQNGNTGILLMKLE